MSENPEDSIGREQRHAVVVQCEPLEGGAPIDADEDLLNDVPVDSEDIDVTHSKIHSLKKLALERFPNVKYACFRQNLLTSLKGVEKLPVSLKSLDLYDNRLERIDHHIEHFNHGDLTNLDLSFNTIRHIKHIDKLVKLKELFLCQNEISQIENLETLTELTNLELGANRIRRIEFLSNLRSLEHLWLAKNKISKLQNLDSLTNLRLLSIQSNRITKIEGLEKLVNLEELYISHNGIEEIEGLEKLTKLTTIDISNNKVRELSGLSHLEDLEELWASNNLIETYDSIERELKHLKKFHTIYLEGNPVQRKSGAMYRKKVQLALGPQLEQIDATPVA